MERTPFEELTRSDLIGLIQRLERRLDEQTRVIKEQTRRIRELEQRHPTPRLEQSYSLRSEERRRAEAPAGGKPKRQRQKSRRRGRIPTAQKLAQATRQENVWPKEFPKARCRLRDSRPVWRIIGGQAVLVAYHIQAGPNGRVPTIPGVPPRGEFGSEIVTALADQHTLAGLPLDTVLAEFSFDWSLKLSRSQADAMLNRLARDWRPEFDRRCQLLAVSSVVSADETSGSIHSV